MNAQILFTPSGTPATFTPVATPGAFSLPTADGSNVDMIVTNNTGSNVWLSFAASAPVGPNAPGSLVVLPGVTVLLTSNGTTLAAAAGRPLVQNTAAGAFATATAVNAVVPNQSGAVTIQRGTAAVQTIF